jgi:hypothetical protein
MKKTLKTLLVVTLVSCLFIVNVEAQTTQTAPVSPWHFGVGLDGGITTSGIFNKTVIGATGRLQYDISKIFALTLTSGYYEFLSGGNREAAGMIPIKLGAKVFVGSGFYFSGEVGAGVETQNFDAVKNLDDGIPKTTKLIWSTGFGYAIKSWDFSLRYESFSGHNSPNYVNGNFGLIGLRAGYSF